MSREERRQYQRLMKGVDPLAPPVPRGAARRRMERAQQKRAARGTEGSGRLTLRYVVVSLIVAATIGLVAFSMVWSSGPATAFAVGIPVALAAFGIGIGLRLFLMRRAATR